MPKLRMMLFLLAFGVTLGTAHAQDGRAGVRVQFVTLHSAGGVSGEAFLPISARKVEAKKSGGACGAELRFEGRHPSAYVRTLEITLRGEGGEHAIDGRCPAATLRATLEDGTVVTGGSGAVRVRERSSSELRGDFDWTATVGGEPLPLKGEFLTKLPETR